MIEIGKSNKDFIFALKNVDEVVEIPLEEMEIMVFKNQDEYFRYNYNKPSGGWRR